MAFARISGQLLNYRLAGNPAGPTVVFVHSLGADLRIWEEVADGLSYGWRTLAYDLRGHGLSGGPAGPYSLDDHVDDLLGLVDHLGLGRFSLVGLSIGGLVAQGLALRAGDRLSSLILSDTGPRIGTPEAWASRISAVEAGGIAAVADPVVERWFSAAFKTAEPDIVAGWRNLLLRNDVPAYIANCGVLRHADLWRRVGSIEAPTLCLVGEEDLTTPPELAEATAKAIPGARLQVLKGAAHLPPLEHPALFAGVLRKFLEELP